MNNRHSQKGKKEEMKANRISYKEYSSVVVQDVSL
ncbi:hypothetical protein FHS80_001771 [Porphyromonas circumdentaria]|nr:hypothetical protein [Porphyromonas circumdentaria]